MDKSYINVEIIIEGREFQLHHIPIDISKQRGLLDGLDKMKEDVVRFTLSCAVQDFKERHEALV